MLYFTELGYVGLFAASFIAATVLPLSSEVVLSFLLLSGLNPTTLVTVATVGNVLGSLVNYAIGWRGGIFLEQKVLKISPKASARAQHTFKKYGVYTLFFAWVPIIGDPLTVVAGALKTDIMIFLVLVTSGKLLRYIVISCAVLTT